MSLPRPRVVKGDPATAIKSDCVAVVAHFDPDGRLDSSSLKLLEGLSDCGVPSLLVTTAPAASETIREWPVPSSTVILTRENIGYDFGSWAVTLREFPQITDKAVILTNNSMLGPFGSLQPLLTDAISSDADVWAVTASLQIRAHIQSFFVRFAPGVLAHQAIAKHFQSVRHLRRKMAIVRKYEIGLSDVVRREGLSTTVWRDPQALGVGFNNPTLLGWRELLDSGYPFLKRTLMSDERVIVDKEVLSEAVALRYGADLEDFLR